jgi:hypothetical protein
VRHICFCVCVLTLPAAPALAQVPGPAAPAPRRSPLEGVWYFRGDPQRVCFIETVNGPKGPRILLTNEHGDEASGSYTNGRVSVPGWKLGGTVRGNRLVWSNGDFWER